MGDWQGAGLVKVRVVIHAQHIRLDGFHKLLHVVAVRVRPKLQAKWLQQTRYVSDHHHRFQIRCMALTL